MRANRILIALLSITIVALLLVSCGSKETPPLTVPAGAQAGDLVDLKPCTYMAGDVEYSADCGTLVVPENRSDPKSRMIALPVLRVHALRANPSAPIFFFQGGPGSSNLQFQKLDGLIEDHDLVLVGYRGVDGSVSLDCPEIADAVRNAPTGNMLSDAALESYADASKRCVARLQIERVDLAGYTMVEVIEDMENARVALGYDRIHLLGESYGTRVEMIYEWMHPNSLYRVVMLDVNPPGHFQWGAEDIDAQLKDYAELCARDADCSTRTNDLIVSMRQVSENIPERWLFFPIDKGGVKLVTFVMFMESIQPPETPVPLSGPAAIDMWLAAEEGDYSGMALLSMMRNMFLPNLFVYGDLLSKASGADGFQDPARDYRAELNPAGSILGSPFTLFHWGLGQGWVEYSIPEQFRQTLPTNIRTLLISGSMDFSTPPQFATNELLPYLSNGEQVILKDFGHTETFWVSQKEARLRLLSTFFNNGKVDASLYTYQSVDFDAGFGWPALAKLLLGIVVTAIVLVAALVWVVVRRALRRKTVRG